MFRVWGTKGFGGGLLDEAVGFALNPTLRFLFLYTLKPCSKYEGPYIGTHIETPQR